MERDFNIAHLINNIDYNQTWTSKMSSFDLEQSFNLLDWLIAEKILHDKNFSINDIESEQRTQLCFNIYPEGNSILHLLSKQGIGTKGVNSEGDFIQAIYSTQGLFEVCSEENDFGLEGSGGATTLEVPILPNMYGYTSLDYCLPGAVPKHHIDYEIFMFVEAER